MAIWPLGIRCMHMTHDRMLALHACMNTLRTTASHDLPATSGDATRRMCDAIIGTEIQCCVYLCGGMTSVTLSHRLTCRPARPSCMHKCVRRVRDALTGGFSARSYGLQAAQGGRRRETLWRRLGGARRPAEGPSSGDHRRRRPAASCRVWFGRRLALFGIALGEGGHGASTPRAARKSTTPIVASSAYLRPASGTTASEQDGCWTCRVCAERPLRVCARRRSGVRTSQLERNKSVLAAARRWGRVGAFLTTISLCGEPAAQSGA